ncbi:uncharacterized protein LOC108914536 [Anoplophora glabripennis]|uniref:uncharacterized protein LOC108914536 n=1 Tax=Anoplophora glabripennis TaxID=217634 RepID=UPI000875910F|nr:uncharacterized protein LOC108914536 [Anoplophora glabripennis]
MSVFCKQIVNRLNLSKMHFAGKVVLITGASSGIGATTAKVFAGLGAALALTGRNLENLQQVASDCASGTTPLLIIAELTSESDTKAIIDQTVERFGRLDVLVNNAAVLELDSMETTSLAQYDNVMNTNVRSLYHITTLAVPHLIKTKGNIVNVSSVTGLRAFSGLLTYSMSKAAVDQFTRCAALDLAPKQVRVNSVNPGVIVTNFQRRAGMNREQYTEFLKRSEGNHALGRNGRAEEVARAIVFLASDDASFITGTTLPVDGGRHAMCPR